MESFEYCVEASIRGSHVFGLFSHIVGLGNELDKGGNIRIMESDVRDRS